MKERINQVIAVAIGVTLGGIVIWGLFTLIQDTSKINSVISFINSRVQAPQTQTAPTK